MALTEKEAQEIVNELEEAAMYLPDDLRTFVKRAVADLAERYNVVTDDTELTFNG